MFNIPNLLTLFRILLIPVVIVFIERDRYDNALLLMVLGGVTDYLDGYIARNFKRRTRLGSLLDPLADKLMVNALFFTFAWKGFLWWSLVILVFGRDLLLIGGAAFLKYIRHKVFEIVPTFVGKTNTFLQICLIGFILLAQIWPFREFVWAVRVSAWAVAACTIVSCVQYWRKGWAILKMPA
ncbi:MAG: CDP-alcohol phosphatidyltransferase family protein [Nitrospirae bacterium]|nr:CDP-alcohol phosphatidyltransferase family protein [Nitrospirota bacterium]